MKVLSYPFKVLVEAMDPAPRKRPSPLTAGSQAPRSPQQEVFAVMLDAMKTLRGS